MTKSTPHFLLFSEARTSDRSARRSAADAQWRFVLEAIDGSERLEAADAEPISAGQPLQPQRLELLAVIRGLEALEQPSRVTLVTPSRYVVHGLRFGLGQWKENDWQWERFGELTPIKNKDLWQRLDAALRIHQVDCRSWDATPTSDLDHEPISPAASVSREEALDDSAPNSLPPAARVRTKRRNLRLDKPHARPQSSAPAGWWGSVLGWMRRAAPTH